MKVHIDDEPYYSLKSFAKKVGKTYEYIRHLVSNSETEATKKQEKLRELSIKKEGKVWVHEKGIEIFSKNMVRGKKKVTENEIKKSKNELSDREKKVLRKYYGLGDYSEQTLAEIGDHFDLSRQRIRQIRDQALDEL